MNQNQNIKALKEHCIYCFDVLISLLNNKKPPVYPQNLPKYKVPLFVTWHINQNDLRGCIGTFSHNPIDQMLGQYAQISAFQDDRFDPISLKEIEKLSVAVSLLVNFEENLKAFDWEVGKHGIIISFKDNEREYNGTFLPEVAKEQGWDQRLTLEYLIKKTGCKNKNIDDIIQKINLTRYQSSKFELSYNEYIQRQ
ncbi:hypothetical protein IMG5_115470 [Ichthyophthirius multifiliis]|uniref:AMMECR1 domain-containing protein n=1 Tax=Ichthyophthirius multifiliis TaxID=5932 RepID=G0QU77_ICHMU|nr:hypothetical protein IMG5_115470 [Ichthyophthirius multifiliis]EGR31214.1 hypothetical protein IMG5_115470 [Ichthyophthirius multifiliis]|eukprot:XP_004034700.1 hypothetical protein IMG5_115470 [Ichthyophthirius multifiliis]